MGFLLGICSGSPFCHSIADRRRTGDAASGAACAGYAVPELPGSATSNGEAARRAAPLFLVGVDAGDASKSQQAQSTLGSGPCPVEQAAGSP
eukprot:CAMPEP_0181495306 /NCGR_PEP_ID=MMETSP1110-20121109/52300_1 /TAXON_ID=174948 /ORGANISM="Symbiodinium sp., Strain CCMP421" /LENGTH=91 /DNA_ID=CAMNT_0023622907 /DNA_START=610 /DNA_END=886 /DNA_ORIENTATION=-